MLQDVVPNVAIVAIIAIVVNLANVVKKGVGLGQIYSGSNLCIEYSECNESSECNKQKKKKKFFAN